MRARLRRGWCPSVLRPMPTGDGLLVRLRPRPGAASLEDAVTMAACANSFGNGHLDLTSRANLQIRGVQEGTLQPLIQRLAIAGLIDPDADDKSFRNVVASPLAGLDPDAAFDIRPAVRTLEARLAAEAALHGLPPKFAIAVDDGGRSGVADVAADFLFTALAPATFAVDLAGAAEPLGVCRSVDLPDVAVALARGFVRLRRADERVRDVVARLGAAALKAASTSDGAALFRASPELVGRPRAAAAGLVAAAGLLGVQRLGAGAFLGAAVAFGALRADDLALFAAAARTAGAAELRWTPWRSVLATGLTLRSAQALAGELGATALILDPADPRLRVAACPGAPACRNATTDVRGAAEALAAIVATAKASGVVLHVSGCRKGCARAAPSPFTLVGDSGRYGLVRGGTAEAAPSSTNLTIAAAAEVIRELIFGERGVH